MLKRREFLKTSALVATVASTGVLSNHASAAHPTTHIDFVVFDETLEDSLAFAQTLVQRGARAFEIEEDIGRLWFGELGAAFTHGKTIAGLTSHTELLVCESFAREHGARLRYEGAHDCRGSDVLTHTLRLTREEMPFSTALAAAESAWPRTLAARLTALSCVDGGLYEDRCRTQTRRSATHPGSLYSWLLA